MFALFLIPKAYKFGQQTAGLLLSLSFFIGASAQINPTQEREIRIRSQQELQRQEQYKQKQRQQQERTPDVRRTRLPNVSTEALPIEKPCFLITRIQLKSSAGVLLPEFDWVVERLTAPDTSVFLGKCIGAKGVAWLIERAQAILIDRGLVTSRILVAQQDMRKGSLALTLIPGRVRAIRLSASSDRTNLSNALPMQVGDILNLRDIEQALENLKRVPTADVDIQIEPANVTGAEPGSSDLVVSYRQSFPFRFSASADDSGSKSTGRYQSSFTVSYDNALNLNDLFYVTINKDLGGGDSGLRGNQGHTIHYSLPFGYWALGATFSTSSYTQTVAGSNQTYIYSGSSENNEVKLSRLLIRDSKQKLNLAIRAFQRKSNNYVDDTEITVQRRVVGGWDSTLNYKIFIQDATLDSSLTYKRGIDAFGSIPAPEEAFNEGTSRFTLLTADMNLTVPFKLGTQRIRYNGSWRIQENQTPLTPQDRFSIGGRYTVRGYDGESALSGERGWLLRNELSFNLAESGQELYLGLDTGQVGGGSSERLVTTRLTGAVLGLRGTIKKLSYDSFIAAPINNPDNFITASSTAGFSLNVNF